MKVLIIQCKEIFREEREEDVRENIKKQIKDGGIIVLSPRVAYEIADIGENEENNGNT